MLNVRIIAVGKLKEKYLVEGIKEYTKRLGRYCKFNIIEVNDLKISDHASEKEQEIIREKEGDQILKHLSATSYIIALCIEGQQFDSLQMASTIKNLAISGNSNITFIIGGSIGLSERIKKQADLKLSFSKLTFPHQLMRLILLEQLYRSFKIINGEVYHK